VVDRTRLAPSSVREAIDLLAFELEDRWVSDAQRHRLTGCLDRFASYCHLGYDVSDLHEVTPDIAAAFLDAPSTDGQRPTPSVQRLRRSSLRMLFRAARNAGTPVGDPTLDLTIAPLSSSRARPLTDEEVAECRGASHWSIGSTRRSATWALAEATCRSGEIPHICVGDIDLDRGAVNIRGGGRCAPRHGRLTTWGIEQVARRIEAVGSDPSSPLVYVGDEARLGGLVSANSTIAQVLRRAGLADEPDVRPSSVVTWAGVQVLESTGRIEEVAKALGLKSLDRAAAFIGWNWQELDGQAPG
jgi:integrase/recombinase XerC